MLPRARMSRAHRGRVVTATAAMDTSTSTPSAAAEGVYDAPSGSQTGERVGEGIADEGRLTRPPIDKGAGYRDIVAEGHEQAGDGPRRTRDAASDYSRSAGAASTSAATGRPSS